MTDTTISRAGAGAPAAAYGVHSEVGVLRKVLVCAPGLAHQRLTPTNCDDLLFDDVLWVHNARRDHAEFVTTMRERGREFAEAPVLRELAGVALRVAPLARALTWHRVLRAVHPDEAAPWQASVPGWAAESVAPGPLDAVPGA